jgi:hypothetical protein
MITTTELQTETLQSKIMELQSALFFTDSASLIKLPTHVIPEVEIDEEGNIWFVIARPAQHLAAFDKEMPTKMDFFQKGKDFFVKVRGVASFVTDHAEIDNNPSLSVDMREKMRSKELVAIQVKVQDMELIDNNPAPTGMSSWVKRSRSQMSSWFFF